MVTYLTVRQVSEQLGCNMAQVYRLLRRQKDRLPSYRMPGVGIRIIEEELLDFMRGHPAYSYRDRMRLVDISIGKGVS